MTVTYHRNVKNRKTQNQYAILDYLRQADKTKSVQEIAERFGINWSTAHQHLMKLQAEGLVEFETVPFVGSKITVTAYGRSFEIPQGEAPKNYVRRGKKQRKRADDWTPRGGTLKQRIDEVCRKAYHAGTLMNGYERLRIEREMP